MKKLKTVLCSYLLATSLTVACYDPKNPGSLPPCGQGAVWPDPCATQTQDTPQDKPQDTPQDATRDATREGDAP